MTMHLEQGLTTLNTKKRKKKAFTKNQLARLEKQRIENNKFFRSIGMEQHQMDKSQWAKYVRGEHKSKIKPRVFNDPFGRDQTFYRDGPDVPMSNNIPVNMGGKKEPQVYSGERKLLGIATMHKSNMVPVFDDKDAKDIAKMRR